MHKESSDLIRVLREEAQALAARRHELEGQLEYLSSELAQIRKRQDLVRALMEASGVSETTSASAPNSVSRIGPTDGDHRKVADIAHSILLPLGKKTMYYEDLAKEVQKAGGFLGGANPAQTLIARIARDPRFVRPEKRGWYAAREFFPRAKNVGARKPARKAAEARRKRR